MSTKKGSGETRLKVLFLEDSIRDLELISEQLSDSGYRLDLTHVEDEAGFTSSLQEKSFDIILSDFCLPGFDGFKALKTSQDICPETPFICVSGTIGEETAIELLKLGAVDYVLKDRPERLPFAITRALEQAKEKRAHLNAAMELLESRNLLNTTQQIARIGGWVYDVAMETMRWTDETYRIHGFEPGYLPAGSPEHIRKSLSCYNPKDRTMIEAAFRRCAEEGTPYTHELQITNAHNKLIWIQTSAQAVIESGQVVKVFGHIMDINDRRMSEEALKNSEERFRNLLRDVPSVAVQGYRLDGTTTYWNPASERLYGYTAEEAIGRTLIDLIIPPEMHEDVRGAMREMAKTNKPIPASELSLIRKDGSRVTVFSSHAIVQGSSRESELFCLDIDRSEQKRAESIKLVQYNIANAVINSKSILELYDSIKNELNAVLEAKNLFIALYNEETGMLSSVIDIDEKDDMTEWSAEKSLTGYVIMQNRPVLLTRDEIVRLHSEGIIEFFGTTAEAWLGVPLKTGGNILGAIVVQSYDNANAYNESSIEIMELVAHELSLYIDRDRTNEKVRKLARAVEQSSISITITDKNGCIEYVNPFFCELTGYSKEEVAGKNPSILKSGHHSNEFYKELWDTILSGNDWRGDVLNRNKAGGLYWTKAVISPIVNGEGVITNFIAIKEDITERQRMMEQIVSAKEKAEESDRLKTAFLNNISHEIRTPMNAIIGFSALLSETGLDEESKNSFIETISISSNLLLAIISDIIEVSNIEAGIVAISAQEINVNDTLRHLESLFSLKANETGIGLKKVIPESSSETVLLSDSIKFKQILSNLLGNAFKFTRTGTIEFGYRHGENFIEFYVSDTGIGIPEDQLSRIFERFYQVDHNMSQLNEGTGLGLSISKAYVELMGGKIWAESVEGKGSVFRFSLPFNNTEGALYEALPISQSNPLLKEYHILIAEDNELNAQLMTRFLTASGLKVVRVKNGEEAVEYCRSGKPADLVLMDLKMPVMDGIEATMQIKRLLPGLPVIAQTAYANTADLDKAFASGCCDIITKPFVKNLLLSKIREHLSEGN